MALGAEGGWEVEFFEVGDGETALDELKAELASKKDLAQLDGQIRRVERYGRELGSNYFRKVQGSSKNLWELRLTVQSGELRFIHVLVGRRFYMLKGFRHTRDADVQRHVPTAEARLVEWGIRS